MELDAVRHVGDRTGELGDALGRQGGRHRVVPVGVLVAAPVHRELVAHESERRVRSHPALVESVAVVLDELADGLVRDQALPDQPLAEQATGGRMLADDLIHLRLGGGRLVGLVVTVPAVADDVDDDVLAEAHPVVRGQPRRQHHGLGIVAVHVEHRRLDHLRHVAAVERRAGVVGGVRGEADLVVADNVHRAAGVETRRLGELERLHHHALPRERGIAVHQHRHNPLAGTVAAAVLPGPHRALDHRVDDLQMRGVEGQGQMEVAAGRANVGREPHVIFHVTGTAPGLGVVVPLELRE
jgi:hypothetical protein